MPFHKIYDARSARSRASALSLSGSRIIILLLAVLAQELALFRSRAVALSIPIKRHLLTCKHGADAFHWSCTARSYKDIIYHISNSWQLLHMVATVVLPPHFLMNFPFYLNSGTAESRFLPLRQPSSDIPPSPEVSPLHSCWENHIRQLPWG